MNTTACRVQFYIPDNIGPPVLLYYQLTNFYQNHRRYVQSFDQDQLKGNFRDNSSISGSNCDPLRQETVGQDAQGNDIKKPYYPCGLIANSMFNDTFFNPVLLNAQGESASNVTYNMTNSGIAWSSDKDLYGVAPYNYSEVVPPPNWRERYPVYNDTFQFPDLKTWEEFQVWMRTAGLPTFSKLALRNDNESMQIGRYEMLVYDCKSWQNPRSQVLFTDATFSLRLPCHALRRHKVDSNFDANRHGRQEPVPGNHIYRRWWHLYRPGRTFHCHTVDQAKVRRLDG